MNSPLLQRETGDQEKGAIAIEFALVALPFFIFLFGIIETAMFFMTNVVIDGAVADATRMLRTGQAQETGDALTAFRGKMEESLFGVADLEDFVIDVRSFSSFGDVDFVPLYDEDGNPVETEFDGGTAGDVVVVRVSYRWDLMTPFLSAAYGSDQLELTGTSVFKNEPFSGAPEP